MSKFSVVICCSEDPRVVPLVDALEPTGARIVLGMTPDRVLERWAAGRDLSVAIAPRGSHALTANAGLDLVPTDHDVLLLDSDCMIEPASVRAVRAALLSHDVVRTPVTFADDGSWSSRQIALARRFDDTYGSPAYKPGLGLSSSVRARLGRVFNPAVRWGVDAELTWRLCDLGYAVHVCEGAELRHDVTPVTHWVRGSFQFGLDDAYRARRLGQRERVSFLEREVLRYRALAATRPRPSWLVMGSLDLTYHVGFVLGTVRPDGFARR